MQVLPNFGHSLQDTELKKVLQELNPGIHFDMGANLNLYHPKIEQWQGIFFNGTHASSMQRGTIPEFNIYRQVDERQKDGTTVKKRGECLFIGWRTTLENLVSKRIPGVTWEALCAKLRVDRKLFTGDPRELEVAQWR
jgi:hypothetical protein